MKHTSFRSLAVIALATFLSACGAGQQDVQMPVQLATAVQSDVGAPAVAATGPAAAPAAGPNNPLPDCAAEGCASLRIIDGNAEAYRVDAMRRAAAEQS